MGRAISKLTVVKGLWLLAILPVLFVVWMLLEPAAQFAEACLKNFCSDAWVEGGIKLEGLITQQI